jgi:cytidylate kinase
MSFIVAIDGPAGSGKGTITSAVAEKFNLMYLDTGATYRCVALKILKEKVKLDDIEKIKEILANIKIEFKEDKTVLLDGEDVTKAIREPDVTNTVSPVSHILEVRLAMVDLQRKIASGKDSILEGRDIGTNVFPNADVKIYLDASVEERVKRRVKQNAEKGIEMSEEEVRQNIITRDETDKSAEVGPLKPVLSA